MGKDKKHVERMPDLLRDVKSKIIVIREQNVIIDADVRQIGLAVESVGVQHIVACVHSSSVIHLARLEVLDGLELSCHFELKLRSWSARDIFS